MAKRLFALSLILSIFLHLFFMGAIWWSSDLPEPQALEPVEFTILDTREIQKNQQVVEQEKRFNDEKPEDDSYLSKFDQRVKKETKAERVARLKNEAGKPKPAKTAQRVKRGDGSLPKISDLKPTFDWDKIVQNKTKHKSAASSTDDYLKDVKTGVQTLLNTREFVYYTYYSRIKQKLRQYWEPKIKQKISRIIRQGREIAAARDRITKIIITLDSNGTLIRVQVVGRSGLEDLDDAAVEAFRAAAPFPNPPKGIVDQDGTIKIRWDFILEANSVKPIRFYRQARRGSPRRWPKRR